MGKQRRTVTLRDETDGPDRRRLCAYVDDDGNLHVDGQDLGPRTASVSGDGEYEWMTKIRSEDIPRLLTVLGTATDDDVLDILEQHWAGKKAVELEKLIRDSGIKRDLFTWSG